MIHITQTAATCALITLACDRCFAPRAAALPGLIATTPESRRHDLAAFSATARLRVVPNGAPITSPRNCRLARRHAVRWASSPANYSAWASAGWWRKNDRLSSRDGGGNPSAHPRARFRWVGDGSLTADWDAGAERTGSRVIRRLPWQNEVPRFLSAADVFMHTAEFEGLAFAILEALAAGLPCAISPNLLGDMPFLNAQNSIAIGDDGRWIGTLRDRAKLCEIGRAARQLAEKEFSFACMAAEYEALYRECAAMVR